MNIQLKNFLRVLIYGWSDAAQISRLPGVSLKQYTIFLDIIKCFFKYKTLSSQYLSNQLYLVTTEEKEKIGAVLREQSVARDKWEKTYYSNWKFLNKFSGIKYDTSSIKHHRRIRAYTKQYGFGENCSVQHGVKFICEHYSVGSLRIGKNVLFARNVDIDYTGDLEIGDGVKIMEGVKILTHAHDTFHAIKDQDLIPLSNRAYKTNLRIGNNVRIASQALILPGVQEIGDNAFISAGSVVDQRVPQNVVVAGNPAKVVAKIPAIILKRINKDV